LDKALISVLEYCLEDPEPDFESLGRVIRGEKQPQKVYFSELGIDIPITQYVTENVLGEKWVPPATETRQAYQQQMINAYSRLGYDYIQIWVGWTNLPQFRERKAADTAGLSRGQRRWVEEGGGIVKSWDDFERIDWANIKHDLGGATRDDFHGLDYAREHLPDGMKMTVGFPFFEMILEWFFGYKDLFILSVDNPKLVKAVFDQWGQKVNKAYEEAVQYPEVGAIFHADDLGYKTSTMLSPEFLRENVFPWFKRYARLAHEQGKMYWYHCCGNVSEVMEDLIEDVEIDAFHSFEDVILPVGEFQSRYGDRIAALGGIDVDKLTRMDETQLRKYVRKTLNECMPGRYALGSGNSVANYVPPQNYLAMLDEGLKWNN
jgi:uroporphyrinogen decarboxylase